MKFIFKIFLLFIPVLTMGQATDSLNFWTLLGQTEDGTVKAFQACTYGGTCKYLLKFKNGQQWDTISFCDNEEQIDTCELTAVQIDGKGLKEININWSFHNYGGYSGHGGFETSYSVYHIWNLDTRKEIFTAMNSYSNFNNYSDWDTDSTGVTNSTESITICQYSYDFSINAKGQIIIKNLKSDNSLEITENDKTTTKKNSPDLCKDSKPDHQEGIYIFKGGKFILTKKE